MYPDCPFARRRVGQVFAVLTAALFAFLLPLFLLLIGETAILAGFIATGIFAFLGLGAFNMMKARYPYAFFFPFLSGYFILLFSIAFARKLIAGNVDPNKILQISMLP